MGHHTWCNTVTLAREVGFAFGGRTHPVNRIIGNAQMLNENAARNKKTFGVNSCRLTRLHSEQRGHARTHTHTRAHAMEVINHTIGIIGDGGGERKLCIANTEDSTSSTHW